MSSSFDGLDCPTHVRYWWVNNPTLGEFCFTMIGRADIEGSKSNLQIPKICRPSQTPHLTMSSAQIDPPKRVLGLKEGVVTRPPIHGVTPTYSTPLKSFHKVGLESSPFPWLWFRWIVDRDIGFPLSVPVLSWLFDARGKIPKELFPVRPPADTRRSALAALAAQAARQQSTGLELVPPSPALRPNPFPKVTDPFCRLLLPTLFHRPEAVHLGYLMR
ncbi:unnamed protein product [Brassica rapa subsp. narinosa]